MTAPTPERRRFPRQEFHTPLRARPSARQSAQAEHRPERGPALPPGTAPAPFPIDPSEPIRARAELPPIAWAARYE